MSNVKRGLTWKDLQEIKKKKSLESIMQQDVCMDCKEHCISQQEEESQTAKADLGGVEGSDEAFELERDLKLMQ